MNEQVKNDIDGVSNVEQPSEQEKSPKSFIVRFGPLIMLASVGAFVYFMGWHRYLSFEQLAQNRELITTFVKDNFLLAVLAYGLIYAVIVALSLPAGSFITILGGFLFGPLIGTTTTVVFATIGALAVFWIAKSSLGEALAEKAGPWLEKLREGFDEHALNYLLFLRLVPAFPFWLINIAPALLKVKTSTYLIGTFFGIIPGTFAFSYVGAGLGSIIDTKQAAYEKCLAVTAKSAGASPCSLSFNVGDLITKEILMALAALSIVALIPVLVQKLRKN